MTGPSQMPARFTGLDLAVLAGRSIAFLIVVFGTLAVPGVGLLAQRAEPGHSSRRTDP